MKFFTLFFIMLMTIELNIYALDNDCNEIDLNNTNICMDDNCKLLTKGMTEKENDDNFVEMCDKIHHANENEKEKHGEKINKASIEQSNSEMAKDDIEYLNENTKCVSTEIENHIEELDKPDGNNEGNNKEMFAQDLKTAEIDENDLISGSDTQGSTGTQSDENIKLENETLTISVVGEVTSGMIDQYRSTMRNVTLNDTVTSIGESAFSNCKALKSIEVSKNMGSIGRSAFANCTGLKEIVFKGLPTIDKENVVFSGLNTTIYYPLSESGWQSIINDESSSTDQGTTNVEWVGYYYFTYCGNKSQNGGRNLIDIIDKVSNSEYELSIIKSEAADSSGFDMVDYGFYELNIYKGNRQTLLIPEKDIEVSSITIEDGVTGIGAHNFRTYNKNFDNIKEIVIPGSVKSINKDAFHHFTSLTSVIFEGKFPKVSETDAFGECKVTFHCNMHYCNDKEFVKLTGETKCFGAEEVTWDIFGYCGKGNSKILKCTLKKIEEIGEDHIYKAEINVDSSYGSDYYMEDYTAIRRFIPEEYTKYIKYLMLDVNIKSIGDYAFNGLSALKWIIINDKIERIGKNAFDGCNSLKEIDFIGDMPEIGEFVFKNIADSATIYYNKGNTTWANAKENGININKNANYRGATNLKWAECYHRRISKNVITRWFNSQNLFQYVGYGDAYSKPDGGYSNESYKPGSSSVYYLEALEGISSIPDLAWWSEIRKIKYAKTYKKISDFGLRGNVRISEIILPASLNSVGKQSLSYMQGINLMFLGDYPEFNNVFAIYNDGNNYTKPTIYYPINNQTWLKSGAIGKSNFSGASNSVKWIGYCYCGDKSVNNGEDVRCEVEKTSDGSYKMRITGKGDMRDYELDDRMIPESYSKDVRTLTIDSGVTGIGAHAFENYNSLKSVDINGDLSKIGSKAFSNCLELGTIDIAGTFPQEFSEDAFNNIDVDVYYLSDKWNNDEKAQEAITNNKYAGASRINWYSDNVAVIKCGDNIYCYIYKNQNKMAFRGKGRIYNYTGSNILANNKDINGKAIDVKPEDIYYVEMENEIQTISHNMLTDFVNLKTIDTSNKLIAIGREAFKNNKLLESVTLPDQIDEIHESIFEGCENLKNVNFPRNTKGITKAMFKGCKSLSEIEIHDEVTGIGEEAFNSCSSLEYIEIPKSVTTIGKQAFEYCSNLNSISIFGQLKIGENAFKDCEGLRKIYFYGDFPTIDSSSFTGISATAYYPEDNTTWEAKQGELTGTYGGATNIIWTPYNIINCGPDDNPSSVICQLVKTDGENCYKARIVKNGASKGEEMRDYEEGNNILTDTNYDNCEIKSIKIEEEISSIGNNAFSGFENLEKISFYGDFVTVGDNAFGGIGSNDQAVVAYYHGDNATWRKKYEAKELTSDYKGATNIKWMPYDMIYCGLADKNEGEDLICKLILTEGGEYIAKISKNQADSSGKMRDYNAGMNILKGTEFESYNVTYVEIDEGVTTIGANAFNGLTSIQRIYFYCDYPGKDNTAEDNIGENAFKGLGKSDDPVIAYYPEDTSDRNDKDVHMWNGTNVTDKLTSVFKGASNILWKPYNSIYCGANSENNYSDLICRLIYVSGEQENEVYIARISKNGLASDGEMKDYDTNIISSDKDFKDFADKIQYIEIENDVSSIGKNAFNGLTNVRKMNFYGDFLAIGDDAFKGIGTSNDPAVIYYPGNNATWQEQYEKDMLANDYAGATNVVWTPYDAIYCGKVGNEKALICKLILIGKDNYMAVVSSNNKETGEMADYEENENIFTIYSRSKQSSTGASGNSEGIVERIHETESGFETGEGEESRTIDNINIENNISVVRIGEWVKSIGKNAFSGLENLRAVVIEGELSTIGEGAFKNCNNLEGIVFLNEAVGNISIDSDAFLNDSFSFYYPIDTEIDNESMKSKGEQRMDIKPYKYCINCGDFSISDGDNAVALVVPHGNNKYKIEIIGSEKVGDYEASYGMLDDSSIEISKNDIISISIGNGIDAIGETSFYNFSGVKEIQFNGAIPSQIDEKAFKGISNVNIYVREGKEFPTNAKIYKSAEDVKWFKYCYYNYCGLKDKDNGIDLIYRITIDDNNDKILNIFGNGEMRDYDDGNIVSNEYEVKAVTVSNGISNLGTNFMNGMTSLRAVSVMNNITKIGDRAFEDCTGLKEIVFPNDLEYLGESVCLGCTGLKSVKLSSKISEINNNAFNGCTVLTKVELPESVTRIGENAFEDCKSLTEFKIQSQVVAIGKAAFKNCTGIKNFSFYGDFIEKIGEDAFGNIEQENSATIMYYPGDNSTWTKQENVLSDPNYKGAKNIKWVVYMYGYCGDLSTNEGKDIMYVVLSRDDKYTVEISGNGKMRNYISGDSLLFAFNGKKSIESIKVDEGVTNIGSNAFYDYTSLVDITLPSTMNYIGMSSFENCKLLSEIEISERITVIEERTFKGCESLTNIKGSLSNITKICKSAFHDCLKLRSISFSEKLISIEDNAFKNCKEMYVKNNPDRLMVMGRGAFYNCCKLSSISIPNGIKNIFDDTFNNCSSLNEIKLADSIESIGKSAFNKCVSIKSMYLPANVKEIRENAFSLCNNIKELYFNGNFPAISNNAFLNLNTKAYYNEEIWTSIDADKAVKDKKYKGAKNIEWINYIKIIECGKANPKDVICRIVRSDNSGYKAIFTGIGEIKDYAKDNLLLGADKDISNGIIVAEFGEGITNVSNYLLYDWINLQSVKLSDTITELGNNSLAENKSLKVLHVLKNITKLGSEVLADCKGLEKIYFYCDFPQEVGENAFENLATIAYYPRNNETWAAKINRNSTGAVRISDIDWNYVGKDEPNDCNQVAYCSGDVDEAEIDECLVNDELNIEEHLDKNEDKTNSPELDIEKDLLSSGERLVENENKSLSSDCMNGDVPEQNDEIVDEKYRGAEEILWAQNEFVYCGLEEENEGKNVICEFVPVDDQSNYKAVISINGSSPSGKIKDFNDNILSDNNLEYNITSAVIEEGITCISDNLFKNASSLETVEIKNNVSCIGKSAFEGCGKIKEVLVPDSVFEINEKAFAECISLESIEFSNNLNKIGTSAFENCKSLSSFDLPDTLESIGERAFYNCNGINSIIIPQNVISIGKFAFAKCASLKIVNLPEKLSNIEDGLFQDCTNLNNINIPDQLERIGSKAFASCAEIKTLKIPDKVTEIGESAFSGCSALQEIKLPTSLKEISNYLLNGCTTLTSVEIPLQIEEIGEKSFGGCTEIKNIYFQGDCPTFTGDNAFEGIDGATVYYPSGDEYQGWTNEENEVSSSPTDYQGATDLTWSGYGYVYCGLKKENGGKNVICRFIPDGRYYKQDGSYYKAVISISSPDSSGKIADYAFTSGDDYLSNISSIIIERGVTEIGSGLFRSATIYWNEKEAISIADTVTNIKMEAFCVTEIKNGSRKILKIPKSVKNIGQGAFSIIGFNEIYFEGSCPIANGYTFGSNGSDGTIAYYPAGDNSYSKAIEQYPNFEWKMCCFCGKTNENEGRNVIATFTSNENGNYNVYISTYQGNKEKSEISKKSGMQDYSSKEQTPWNKFRHKIQDITISAQVLSVGSYAFSECEGLKNVKIYSSEINSNAFSKSNIVKLMIFNKIPIRERAFYKCGTLDSVIFYSGFESIGKEAFAYCRDFNSLYADSEKINNSTPIEQQGDAGTDGNIEDAFKGNKINLYCSETTYNEMYKKFGDVFVFGWKNCSRKIATIVDYNDSDNNYYEYSIDNKMLHIYGNDCGLIDVYNRGNEERFKELDIAKHIEDVETIIIEDGITKIGYYGFSRFANLKSVKISNTVTDIYGSVFSGCKNLTSVILSENITSLKYDLFNGCTSLTSVTIPENVTSLEYNLFNGCTSLTSVTIPESVTSLGYSLFEGCKSLTSVTIPESVTSIGYNLFNGCKSLISVTIPEGVTDLGSGLFYGCTSLTSVTIPESVTDLGSSLFDGCTSLTSVTIPKGVTSLGNFLFWGCTSLTSVTIPESVTNLGSYLFNGCTSLTSVTILGNVTSLGNNLFNGCTSLTSVTIPESVTNLENNLFNGCTELKSICFLGYNVPKMADNALSRLGSADNAVTLYYPDGSEKWKEEIIDTNYKGATNAVGKTFIRGYCGDPSVNNGEDVSYIYRKTSTDVYEMIIFGNGKMQDGTEFTNDNGPNDYKSFLYDLISKEIIDDIASVTIEEGVTNIGMGAFANFNRLISLKLPSSIASIGKGAFIRCVGLTEITLPAKITKIEDCTFFLSGLINVTLKDNINSIGDYAFYANGLTKIILPSSVVSIGESAFTGCKDLTSVTFEEGIKTIGSFAFAYSSLTEVTLPGSVVSIGEYAFGYCEDLTSVILNEGIKTIGECSFACCERLASVTLNEGIKMIGNYAFTYSGLTKVTLPSSVASIGECAFSGCNSLTKMYFKGNFPETMNIFGTSNPEQDICIYYPEGNTTWTGKNKESITAMYTNVTFEPENTSNESANDTYIVPYGYGSIVFSGNYSEIKKIYIPSSVEDASFDLSYFKNLKYIIFYDKNLPENLDLNKESIGEKPDKYYIYCVSRLVHDFKKINSLYLLYKNLIKWRPGCYMVVTVSNVFMKKEEKPK